MSASQDDTTVVADPPQERPARRLPRWVPPALCGLVLLLGAVLALSARVGPVQGDETQHFALTNVLLQLDAGEELDIELTATQDDLSQVGVMLGTWVGSADCTLTTTLTEDGRELASQDTVCADLPDTALAPVLSFDPIADSAGTTYTVTLAVSEDSVNGPAVWDTADGSQAVVALYGEQQPALAAAGDVLDRMSVYAPAWGSPGWVVVLAALVLACVAVLALRPRWGLVTVIVLVLARGLLWSALIPPLQGMDEGAHFANVQFIAEEGRLPNWNTEDRQYGAYSQSLELASDEMHVSAHQPTDRPDYDPESAEALREADSAASPDSDGTGPAASYPPAYYGPAAVFYQLAGDDTVSQVHAVRLWSALLGVVAIVFAWFFAGEVLPKRPAARAGLVTAVALQPMLAHQFALVNNDAWVIAAGFAALWAAARLVRSARAPWLMLGAGAIAGLGALGKPFFAVMVLPIAIGWLLGKIRYRVRDWKVLVGEPLLAGVGVAGTYGVWLVAARLLGINTGLGFPAGEADAPRGLVDYLRSQLDPALAEFRTLWVDQLWGNFGWVNTPLPVGAQKVIWWLYLALALTVVVWLVLTVRDRRRGVLDEGLRDIDRLIALCTLSGLGVLAGMYAVEFGYFASSGLSNLLQGRYLLMVIPALLALPPLLAERLSRQRPAATIAAWSVATGVLALHVTGVLVVVQKFYL